MLTKAFASSMLSLDLNKKCKGLVHQQRVYASYVYMHTANGQKEVCQLNFPLQYLVLLVH